MIEKKTAALVPSVSADGEQSNVQHNGIVTNSAEQINRSATKSRDSLKTVSMTELYDTVYPPRTLLVDGLLYTGTYLFVGAPKIGKSFLMAQLGYHIATGLDLWNYPVHAGAVLYLALEDSYARLQKRLSMMFGVEGTERLHFATQSKSLGFGLDQQMREFIQSHPDTKLIIIDTLQKVREVDSGRYSYANDYEIVAHLKQFSDEHGICLLIVHHTRKMESEDSFEMISGTNGLLGAADGAFILQKKKRTDAAAVLNVVGRDQQDQELTLEFDHEHCIWRFIKAETELWKVPPDPILEKVASVIGEKTTEWSGTTSELLSILPSIDMPANVLTRYLNVNAERLLDEYDLMFSNKRTHDGRIVMLTRVSQKA